MIAAIIALVTALLIAVAVAVWLAIDSARLRERLNTNPSQMIAAYRSGLSEILDPLRDDLDRMRRDSASRADDDARDRVALAARVADLARSSDTVGREARRLTDALKGNSRMQGDWGETILTNLLERSGLVADSDYSVQQSITDDDGRRLRPDVVVRCPGGRMIVIDSKVSVQAYINSLQASDEAERQRYIQAHLTSVKNHLAELRRKSYQDTAGKAGERLDFVVMFMPHEGAYLAAIDADPNLWQAAFDSRVVIATPAVLMATLKLVEQLWSQERRSQHADEIAARAGRLLDKLRTFCEDLDRMDSAMRRVRESWDAAHRKLTTGPGNLIGQAEQLRRMGVASKDFPTRFTSSDDSEGDQ